MAFLMNMLSAGMQYKADKAQAKAQRAWQAYSNKMVDISADAAQNTITTNELFAADAFAAQGLQLQKDTMFTRARTEVSAAAAGVKGKSVNRQLKQVMANSSAREFERQEAFRNTMLGFDQQRENTELSAAMQKDYSYIPKPKFASYFLNAVNKTANQAMSAGMGG